MRVTVEDDTGRVVIDGDLDDDPDGELVAKSWAAYNAAHPKGTRVKTGKAPKAPTPDAFHQAQQTLAEERAGGKPTKAALANAHRVHEAHLAHLAHVKAEHEKAEQEAEQDKAEAKAATPAAPAAKPIASRQAGNPVVTAKAADGPPQECMPGVPGFEGSLGPLTDAEYCAPHVYARDVSSGAGNCVCGAALGDELHTEAAPGVPVPDSARTVLKGAGPQRYVLGIAYQVGPDPRIAKGQDGGRDFFTAAELEKAAWEFLANGPRTGMFHLDGTEFDGNGEAVAKVVESYVYRGPDWDLGGGLVAKSGDWLLGAILSPKAWDMHQRGLITGWSPQGMARRRKYQPAP